jgi:hypothetical protein
LQMRFLPLKIPEREIERGALCHWAARQNDPVDWALARRTTFRVEYMENERIRQPAGALTTSVR